MRRKKKRKIKEETKGDPVPTRFDPPEDLALNTLKISTGLSKAEIIRRSVRLLAARANELGSIGFILDDLAPDETARTTEEADTGYGQKKSQK